MEKTPTDIEFLNQLLESKGWQILKRELQKQIDWCTNKALDPDDESMRKKTTISQRDLMLKWRKYSVLLSQMPENLIASLKGEAFELPSDFDIYPKESDLPKI